MSSILSSFIKSIYKIYSQHPFTTSIHNIHSQHLFTTSIHNIYLQILFTNSIHKIYLQNPFTTSIYKFYLQILFTKFIYKIHSQHLFTKFIYKIYSQHLFVKIYSSKLVSKGFTFRNKSAILILDERGYWVTPFLVFPCATTSPNKDEGRYCWATLLATSCRTNSSFLLANHLTKNALKKFVYLE